MESLGATFQWKGYVRMRIFATGWSDDVDGPGHRRIFYLKGCNLACPWCASPESISSEPCILFYPNGIKNGEDLSYLCPHGALRKNVLDRACCRKCAAMECADYRKKVFVRAGTEMTADEIFDDILHQKDNWRAFDGVTFGGGEPTLQSAQLIPLLKRLREKGIHTVIETNASTDVFANVAKQVSLLIADLKAGTEITFRKTTGGELKKVHENLLFASENIPGLLIRIPFVPGINDSMCEKSAMAEFLALCAVRRMEKNGKKLKVEILPFHRLGLPKYHAIGWKCKFEDALSPQPEQVGKFISLLKRHQVDVIGKKAEKQQLWERNANVGAPYSGN